MLKQLNSNSEIILALLFGGIMAFVLFIVIGGF